MPKSAIYRFDINNIKIRDSTKFKQMVPFCEVNKKRQEHWLSSYIYSIFLIQNLEDEL